MNQSQKRKEGRDERGGKNFIPASKKRKGPTLVEGGKIAGEGSAVRKGGGKRKNRGKKSRNSFNGRCFTNETKIDSKKGGQRGTWGKEQSSRLEGRKKRNWVGKGKNKYRDLGKGSLRTKI